MSDILKQESMEKEMRVAEMQMNKASNTLTHTKEIMSRPKKTWFQTEHERQQAKLAGKVGSDDEDEADEGAGEDKSKKGKKGKKDEAEDEEDDEAAKKKKEDKYAGLSRKQRRRRMMIDQQTQSLARESAEAKAAQLAQRSDDDDDDDGPKPAHGKNKAGKVRVTKQDLAEATAKMQAMQNSQKVTAKSLKKQAIREQRRLENGGHDDQEEMAAERAWQAQRQQANAKARGALKRKGRDEDEEGDDDHAGDGDDGDASPGWVDMEAALGHPGNGRLSKKAKRAIKNAGEDDDVASRFSRKRRGTFYDGSTCHCVSSYCVH